jgi:hypothetical protein
VSPGDLEAYVLTIERHFRAWRGTDHVLSPRDFALARSWCEAEVPLAHVLVGIDRAFEADPLASSLVFCRRRIEEMADGLPAPARPVTQDPGSLATIEEALRGLEERLRELPPPTQGVFGVALDRVRELRDLVAVAARPNWDYLRAKLQAIDEAVGDAAPRALEPAEAQAIQTAATRSAERHRGRVDAAALESAVGRSSRARARERLRLPRVSVL